MNTLDFTLRLLPELVLLVTAFAVLGLGCVRERRATGAQPESPRRSAAICALGLVVAGGLLIGVVPTGSLENSVLVIDPLTRLFKLVLLVIALAAVALLRECPPERHRAENFAMLLFTTLGLLLVIGTEELLVLFIGLELTAVSLYIMVGFTKSDPKSAEAAFKYFLFGSVAAAFLLFGFSLIFGFTGSTELRGISQSLRAGGIEPILAVGMVMALAGFGFKVAAVPFHLWSPDVYEGAPVPAAALIASGSKVAGFFILAKFLLLGLGGVEGAAGWGAFASGWVPLIGLMAALSMVLGNLAALTQTSVRRLLAYSGIGHAGFMLTALTAATPQALEAVLFYSVIYAVATLGAFGVVALVLRQSGGDRMDDFAGLHQRSPFVSFCMLLFLTSLAGLPPLAGFFGKFFLFTAAMGAGGEGSAPALLWLVGLGLFMSAVSLYYYLIVVKHMFFVAAPEGAQPLGCSKILLTTVGALAGTLLVLGCAPDLLLGPIGRAVSLVF